jgi:capsular polysaccharide biosynthesis protein
MGTSGGSDPDFQYDESLSPSGRSSKPSLPGSPGIIGRLVRRLPLIALLWLVISTLGVYLVYLLIEPNYESSSTLRIEPSPDLFGPSAKGIAMDFGQYLETQCALIRSNRVLEPAITRAVQSPGYDRSMFPVIRDSTDPKTDIRKRLSVNVIPGTYLITITFSSPSAIEAAEVVNQVVSVFERENANFNEGMNGVLRTSYESYLKKLLGVIKEKQAEMLALAKDIDRQVASAIGKTEKPRREEDDVARLTSHVDELRISFVRDELTGLKDMRDIVTRKLEQLQFESQGLGAPRVYVVDAASASGAPRSGGRILLMEALPPAILVVLLGFYLVLEARFPTRRPTVKDPNLP